VTIHMDDGSTQNVLIYTQTDDDVTGLDHVPGGDWTEYKRQVDDERRASGLYTDGWGPRDVFVA
jgi:hypothetical protein